MLLVAIFADLIAPYGFTKLDLRNRLAPPGNAAALARHRRTRPRCAVAPGDVDPRLAPDRIRCDGRSRPCSAPRSAFLQRISAALVEQTRADAGGFPGQHAVPDPGAGGAGFLRQFAAAADRPDGAVRLGALCAHLARPCHLRQRAGLRRRGAPTRRDAAAGLSSPHPAQHRLDPDRLDDAGVSRSDPAGVRPVVPRAGRAAADDEPRQHGRLRPRIPDARALDHAVRRPRPSC